ncbi:sensor histidine kinase [Nitrospirillum iridis]|uniref:PAS domain S-box-containing protein n=1 Tax=Nitrospirillum iridis TaxID=765888 RepID=A0A7X0AYG3_9PROT|nr:PAS domain S-box protein [Nitrospirillum iridis]MBB6250899.1 PAS domain S-box-containing protein [Nitrospirillum iridis]
MDKLSQTPSDPAPPPQRDGQQWAWQIVESAPTALVMINGQGRIDMVNAQAERVFGYSRGEMLGQAIEMLVPERFRATHPGLRASFFAMPTSRPMGADRDLFGLRRDGTEFPIEIGLNPIQTEAGVMVLSTIVDITSRKRLEERFRRVIEFAPNAMVMTNSQGRIEMVNAQTEVLFGYSREELLGQLIEVLVPHRFRGDHPGRRADFFATPSSRPMGAGRDLFGLRRDGGEFPVEIGLNPIETDEGTMVLSAIVDISDRKQREERVRASLKEKETLLAEIHHRVKNNLQIIDSLLNLQRLRISDEGVRAMLSDAQNRVSSMALIHQTLYQSKNFQAVDFGKFINALVPILIGAYAKTPEACRISVNAQEVAIPLNAAIPCGLIVNELISNALKHAYVDGRQGEISIELRDEGTGLARLSVTDDGVGLPPDLDLAQTGTLGLQLVTLLADQLDAELDVHRAAPTRFVLRFPKEPIK